MMSRAFVCVVLCTLVGCTANEPPANLPPAKLSDYGLFQGNGSTQEPAAGVIPYDVNSELFADYALKFRFVKLPPGTQATYHPDRVFDLPVGTILVKTFAYADDLRQPAGPRRLIETRLLIHRPDGWVGLPYVWNDAQTEAFYEPAGTTVDVAWVHTDGQPRTNNYLVPNLNQCKGCHRSGGTFHPIGIQARHLNRDFDYADGVENQLNHWHRVGALDADPDPATAPRAAVWHDASTGSVDERARAWLDINCAHCHHEGAPAQNAGLDLAASAHDPVKLGVRKPPVAAGRGSGGLRFDILPGQPRESILVYRMQSTDPGVMMPELGKRLIPVEALDLIQQWIAEMQ